MIIVLRKDTPEENVEKIKETLIANGMSFNVLMGAKFTLIPVVGDLTTSDIGRFKSLPSVEKVIAVSKPYYLVSSQNKPEKTIVDLGDGVTLGEEFVMISGPCSVESEDSLEKIAEFLQGQGVRVLRGGTFKLRTSPYSFQGLGEKGLKILREVSSRHNMKCISEIVDIRNLDVFLECVDVIQVGARNMMNFSLLKELGRSEKPVLLKRSMSAKIDDFLLSAEYLMSEGNENIILCERGVQTFDDITRSSVDIASIPMLKDITHLPVFFDPSHSVGVAKYVPATSFAAVSMGVDGLMIETHFNPSNALSDGYQTINFETFEKTYTKINKLIKFMDEED